MRIFPTREDGHPGGAGRRRPRWLLAATLTSVLASAAPPAHAEGGWAAVPEMLQARTGHGTTTAPCPEAVDGLGEGPCVYVVGGHPLEAALSAHAYSPRTRTWAKLPPMSVGRSGLAVAAAPCPKGDKALKGTCVYAVGGTNGSGSLTTVEAYSPATNTWAALPAMPTGRGFLGATASPCPTVAAAPARTCVYAVGGSTRGSGTATSLSAVEVYDPATGTWSALPELPTPRRSLGVASATCPGAVALRAPSCVYAVGGVDAAEPVGTVEVLDPGTRAWRKLPAVPTARRGMGVTSGPCPGATTVPAGTCVYGIGGSSTTQTLAVATTEVFTPGTGGWSSLPSLPRARFGFGATAAPCSEDLSRTCVYAPGGAVGTTPGTEVTAFDVSRP
ncbi:Kelch repeat-containing protein [Streptomyces sp. HMX112]|uniref:Kelch repeat-containing protein n=1 Tax=Streptomyces sp. HMX112 TaxID=3390850 RepID=UPI003A7F8C93